MDDRDPMAFWAEIARTVELPLRGLCELTELRATLDRVERELVRAARRNQSTWQEIGAALRISRQTAYTRHRPSVRSTDGDSPRRPG